MRSALGPGDLDLNAAAARRLDETVRSLPPRPLTPGAVLAQVLAARDVRRVSALPWAPTRVVIAAAGQGTRFGAAPKAVASGAVGRPLLLRVLDSVARFDARPVVIVHSSTAEAIVEVVRQDGRYDPLYVYQPDRRGMGDAVARAEVVLGDFRGDVLVTWADMGAIDTRATYVAGAVHQVLGAAMTLPTMRTHDPYVAVLRSNAGRPVGVLERREGHRMPGHGEADCGTFWVRSPDLFGWLRMLAAATRRREVPFVPLLNTLAMLGEPALAVCVSESADVCGVNTRDELAVADATWSRMSVEHGAALDAAGDADALLDALETVPATPALRRQAATVAAALGATLPAPWADGKPERTA